MFSNHQHPLNELKYGFDFSHVDKHGHEHEQSLLILGKHAWSWLKMLLASEICVFFNPQYLFKWTKTWLWFFSCQCVINCWYISPPFLHSLVSLYSFFSPNTGVPLLPCTGFFHDVFDNCLWNEIIVRVTGTKFFSKAWYKYFNVRPLSSVKNIFWQSKFDMSIETFLTKYVSWVALKSQHDVVEIVFGL